MKITKYNSMVNGIFHIVFCWTCSRAAGAAAGGGAGMLVAVLVVQVLQRWWRRCSCGGGWWSCRGWASFLRDPWCFLSEWCQMVHFYFWKHQLPGHQPGQHSFFLLWQKMCMDQRKHNQVCHLSLLSSDITPPHSPTFKASPAFLCLCPIH